MNQINRLIPYVWPHRRKILWSVLFALLVAVFWGLNLSSSYLVVKVFLEKKNLATFLNEEMAVAEHENQMDERILHSIQADIDAIESGDRHEEFDGEYMKLLKKRSRKQSDLDASSRKLWMLTWAKANIIPWLPKDEFDMFALILGVLVVTTALKGLFIFIQENLIGTVVELASMDLRKDCFRHTLRLDYQTLSHEGTPALMSHFTYNMQVLAQGLQLVGGKVIREPLKAAACIVLAFFVSWQLTLLSLLFAPLAVVVFYRIGRKLKLASHRVMESMSRIYKTLEETFDSMKVVIAFNGFARHRHRFHRENKEYLNKALKIVKIEALTSPVVEMLGMLAAFMALLPGAYLVLRGTRSIWGITLVSSTMDIAELSMLYVLLAGVIDPARKLSTTYTKVKRAAAAAEKIFGLMDMKSLVVQPTHPKPAPRLSRSIEFHKVSFTYARHDADAALRPPALDDVTLEVKAGEVIVVVGENGSGKSTLVNLLPRYYDPDHGSIKIDGVDIRECRLRDLRAQMSVVTQETLLFDETIYENIRYSKPSATRNEVERAARLAHITNFIDKLPDGFETKIGDKGGRLSGGQRQRIALARAILREPSILILDEATSAIDSQSKLLIYQTLREFAQGRTVFIITHSVSESMLDFVSRIAVMDHGRLIAVGTHQQLIETCPVYQRLYHAGGAGSADALNESEQGAEHRDDARQADGGAHPRAHAA